MKYFFNGKDKHKIMKNETTTKDIMDTQNTLTLNTTSTEKKELHETREPTKKEPHTEPKTNKYYQDLDHWWREYAEYKFNGGWL